MTCDTEDGEKITLVAGEWLLVLKALYGFRPAPRLWQQHAVKVLAGLGSKQSKIEAMLFYNEEAKTWIVLHVDDLLVVGPRAAVDNLRTQLSKQLNVRRGGWLETPGDSAGYLGRGIHRLPRGFEVGVSQKLI